MAIGSANGGLPHGNATASRPRRSVLEALPSRVSLVALDFDGVMTDNAVFVGQDGQEWVRCSRGDGMGITLLRRAGIPVMVLSTETNPVVSARCRKLKIECIQCCEDKAAVFERLLTERAIPIEETVFVGNDINDLGCLELAGCGVVVADAHPSVLSTADAILSCPGGHGAVRELCDLVLRKVGALPQ